VDEELIQLSLHRHTALADALRSLKGTRAVVPETSAELGKKLLSEERFQAVLKLRSAALAS
jgi:hypothetical protein